MKLRITSEPRLTGWAWFLVYPSGTRSFCRTWAHAVAALDTYLRTWSAPA